MMPAHRFVRFVAMVFVLPACLGVATNSAHGQDVRTTSISKERFLNPARIRLDERLLLSGKLTDSTSRIAAIAVDTNQTVYILDSGNRKLTVVEGGGRSIRTVPVLTGSRSKFKPLGMAVARDSVLVFGAGPCTDQCPQIETIRVRDAVTTRMPRTASRGYETYQILVFDTKGVFREAIEQHSLRMAHRGFRGTDSGWVIQEQRAPIQTSPMPIPVRELVPDSLFLLAFQPRLLNWTRVLGAPAAPYYSIGFFMYPRFMGLSPTFAVASDAVVYTNDVGGFVINVRSASGTPSYRITGDVDRIPVTDAEMHASLKREIERDREGNHKPHDIVKELTDHGAWVGREEFRPVLGEMFASRGGRVIVRRIDLESLAQNPAQSVWDVVSVSEGLLGRFTLSTDERVETFEWPFLYVRLGSEHGRAVVRYRLLIEGKPD